MTLTEIIALVVLLAVVGFACWYIIKEKKRGVKCVGCPYAESCASRKNGGGCSGSCHSEEK